MRLTQTIGIRDISKPVTAQTTVPISPCAIRRIIQLSVPVQFSEIHLTDSNGTDVTQSSMYSWSADGVCWTGWVPYQQYLQLARAIEGDFYLRILIFSSVGELKIGGILTTCYSICLDSTNQFLIDFCGSPNLFDPYAGLDCALMLQQQLSDTVVCMLGIPAYYFKVSPDADTADWTFKEYILHSVESVKYVKLVCQDGALPSSNPQMSEFDFDWENDWEVEMSKTAFAAAFGDTAFPKQRDLVYVPMMKRMYEVNAAYDEKNEGLMWRSTTWKLALVKYNEKDNVSHGSYEELIDNLVENQYMELFKPVEENEQYRESGSVQAESPKFAATNLYNVFMSDGIRLDMTQDTITIDAAQVNNGSTVVCRNYYRGSDPSATVRYQKKFCSEDGTLMLCIGLPSVAEYATRFDLSGQDIPMVYSDLFECGEMVVGCGLKFVNNDTTGKTEGTMLVEFNGSTVHVDIDPSSKKNLIVVAKWKRRNFTTELAVYESRCRSNDPVARLRPANFYFDFANPVGSEAGPYNDDYNDACGAVVDLHPYPVDVYYMKMFNRFLDDKKTAVEASKYTTTEETCIINDLARPVFGDRGYNVR